MATIDTITDFTDEKTWDAYVHAHPESRFCDLFAYRCVEKAYGYRPRYFGFVKNNELVGVLPAFETRSLFFGRRLVSQPFSEYGGFLLNPDLAEEDFQEILEQLKRFLSARKLAELEMHGLFSKPVANPGQYLAKSNAQSLAFLPLDRPLDELWSRVITYQVRKAVQKAERSGLKVVERSDNSTLVSEFFPLYLASMKRLGVPPHSIQYYLQCRAAFGDRMGNTSNGPTPPATNILTSEASVMKASYSIRRSGAARSWIIAIIISRVTSAGGPNTLKLSTRHPTRWGG